MIYAVVIPPVRDFYLTPHRFSALGGYTVKEVLESLGHSCTFFHFPLRGKGIQLPLPSNLSYLKPHLIQGERGAASYFTTYRHYGPEYSECCDEILHIQPDTVFISCFAWCYSSPALSLAEELKKRAPEVKVTFGGAAVSAHPEYFRTSPWIDSVIEGEAEIYLPRYLSDLKNGRKESCYRGEFTTEEDLKLITSVTGETKKHQYVSLMLTRGCPRKCRFCSNFLSHGRTFRKTPLKEVEKGIKSLTKEKPLFVNFEDDNLLCDKEYFFQVLALIKAHNPRTLFSAENGMDYMKLDSETLKLLINRGFRQFNLSMGSLSPQTMQKQERPLFLQKLTDIYSVLREKKIPSITYFICGFKEDTLQSITETLLWLAESPSLIGISLFYALPGIAGFEETQPFTRLGPEVSCGSSAYPWNGSLTTEQLITAFRLARVINLIKKEDKSSDEKLLLETTAETLTLHTLIKEKKESRIIPVPRQDENLSRMVIKRLIDKKLFTP